MVIFWVWLVVLESMVARLSDDKSFERRMPQCVMFQVLLLMFTLFSHYNEWESLDSIIMMFWLSTLSVIGYALILFWRWLGSKTSKRVQMGLIVCVHLLGCLASVWFKMHLKNAPISSLDMSMLLW